MRCYLQMANGTERKEGRHRWRRRTEADGRTRRAYRAPITSPLNKNMRDIASTRAQLRTKADRSLCPSWPLQSAESALNFNGAMEGAKLEREGAREMERELERGPDIWLHRRSRTRRRVNEITSSKIGRRRGKRHGDEGKRTKTYRALCRTMTRRRRSRHTQGAAIRPENRRQMASRMQPKCD